VYFVQDYGAHAGQPIEEVAATWRLPLHKIVISKYLMRLIEEHDGSRGSEEMAYIPNAVDPQQFNAPPRGKQNRPTVGFVYSLAPQKGCDVMLAAVRAAAATVPNLRLLTYGPDQAHPDLPLPDFAHHRPFAPEHELRTILSQCDAWLFGSRLEGFGLPILEAMACRTPVIATRAGAAPELLANGSGVLVEIDDVQGMAQAIGEIARMPNTKWRAMSDAAYATATSYTWGDAADRFEAALQHAIAQRIAKPGSMDSSSTALSNSEIVLPQPEIAMTQPNMEIGCCR
jgi:glycosyltransferase involved in cell wall biosynthesis